MIEPPTDGIPMQIVRHSHKLLDFIHGVQMGNYSIFKTLTLITVNVGQDSIDIEAFVD